MASCRLGCRRRACSADPTNINGFAAAVDEGALSWLGTLVAEAEGAGTKITASASSKWHGTSWSFCLQLEDAEEVETGEAGGGLGEGDRDMDVVEEDVEAFLGAWKRDYGG